MPSGCNPDCPACRHRSMTQGESIAQKQGWLASVLDPWKEVLLPVRHVDGQAIWNYRDKVLMSVRYSDSWQAGVIRRDELIPIQGCPVHTERVRQTVALLLPVFPSQGDFPLVFWVQSGAQLVLVLKSRIMPPLDWMTGEIARRLADIGVEGLWVHLHPSAGQKVFGKGGWNLVWGKEVSVAPDGLLYGPAAFQQLIPDLYKESIGMASQFLCPDKDSAVIDLYCGVGASLRVWIDAGAAVIGVEVSGEAVKLASLNAPGAMVLRGSCSQRIPQLISWSGNLGDKSRLLYLNPPRTGLEEEVIRWIFQAYKPVRVAYMSCSAGTMRRDLNQLSAFGYIVEKLIPFDFFPRTHHVECLALLKLAL